MPLRTLPSSDHRRAGREGRRPGAAFAALVYVLAVLLVGPNLATPLYPAYERVFGFSPLVVTLIFATYVAVLIPSLMVFGPLSDAVGRRRVLAPAIIVAAAGSALFAMAPSTGWLFAARAVQGVALGAVQGTATAALVEAAPGGDPRLGAMAATTAAAAGSASGPLLAGLLAGYAPAPRVLPYLVHLALLAVALVLVTRLLTTTARRRPWRPRRPTVPPPIRRTFAVAGLSGFLAWAVAGLFLALIPSWIAALLHSRNPALTGGVVALMLGCSAVGQVCFRRLTSLRAQALGLSLLAVGLATLVVAGQIGSVAVMLAATVLAGLGNGLAFLGSAADVNAVAPPARRADIVSSLFVIVYLGASVPVIGVGLISVHSGLAAAVRGFAVAVGLGCLIGLVILWGERRRPDRLAPTGELEP